MDAKQAAATLLEVLVNETSTDHLDGKSNVSQALFRAGGDIQCREMLVLALKDIVDCWDMYPDYFRKEVPGHLKLKT